MMEYPKISIVTPNWNCARYLETTIKSILAQDYPNLDYVVIDGGSTDGSLEIINRYAPQLAAFRSEPDRGLADAMNKGFGLTSGSIMGWINSDDILLPGALATVSQVFEALPHVEWITGMATVCSEQGSVFNVLPPRYWSRARFLAGDFRHIQQESTFWRRSLWDRAGAYIDETISYALDFELWTRFFRSADLYTVNALIGSWRLHEGQRSIANIQTYDAECRVLIERELDTLTPHDRAEYRSVIPEEFRALNSKERVARDELLSIEDLPVIEYTPARKRFDHAPIAAAFLPNEDLRSAEFDGKQGFRVREVIDFQAATVLRVEIILGMADDWDSVARGASYTYPQVPVVAGPVFIRQLSRRLFSVSIHHEQGTAVIKFQVRGRRPPARVLVEQVGAELRVSLNGETVYAQPDTRFRQGEGRVTVGFDGKRGFWQGVISVLSIEAMADGNLAKWSLDPDQLSDPAYARRCEKAEKVA